MKKIKESAACVHTLLYLKMCSVWHLRTFARKTSTIQIFFILWLQSDNKLPMSEMQKN